MMDFFLNFFDAVKNLIETYSDFYFFNFLIYLFKLTAALIITLPLALEREYHARNLGLRTFPLLAVASCGFVLISESFIEGIATDVNAGDVNIADVRGRIMQGLMTGIGFLGGGAILKTENRILGTATAVSLWSTGTVGAAVAFDRYEIAILVAGMNFLVLRLLSPLKEKMENDFHD